MKEVIQVSRGIIFQAGKQLLDPSLETGPCFVVFKEQGSLKWEHRTEVKEVMEGPSMWGP